MKVISRTEASWEPETVGDDVFPAMNAPHV